MQTLNDVLMHFNPGAALDGVTTRACRQALYKNAQPVTQSDAEILMALCHNSGGQSPEWQAFYQEAMADLLVHQGDPEGYISDDMGAWILQALSKADPLGDSDIDMLLHLLETANQTPAALSTYVLDQIIARSVILVKATGKLPDTEVERIRMALYATGSDSNIAVTRHEAQHLFALNAMLKGADVNPAFDVLFAKAVGNAVLYEPLWQANAEREKHYERWLTDRDWYMLNHLMNTKNLAGNLRAAGREIAHLDFDNHDMANQYAVDQIRLARAEKLTDEEEHWLLSLLSKDARTDPREQALFQFLRDNARSDDGEADISARMKETTDAPRLVFGHRAVPLA